MFIRIKDVLLNTDDVDMIQPRWEGSQVFLEVLFRNRKHPIRILCDNEAELDEIFQHLTDELTAGI
jgi:hypothetical protein